MGRLAGRIAVITGGTRGIGLAIARAMAAEGAKVVVASRKQPGVDAAVATLTADYPDAVVGRVVHVGKLETLAGFVEEVEQSVGPIDILVNNAGTNPYFGPMLGTEWAAWDKTFDVNLKGPFELARLVSTRAMNAGRAASIINISSILGQNASVLQGVYGMTKAAMISMTKTLAMELGGAQIRVNCIAPGVVDTRLAAAIVHNPQLKAMVTERTALKRVALPEEISGIAVFLASDESSYTTGQTFTIDGGYTIA